MSNRSVIDSLRAENNSLRERIDALEAENERLRASLPIETLDRLTQERDEARALLRETLISVEFYLQGELEGRIKTALGEEGKP